MDKAILPTALAAALSIGAAQAFAQSQPQTAQQPPSSSAAQGGVKGPLQTVTTATLSGTVSAIDRDHRLVAVQPEQGHPVTIAVGPDIRNFGNLKPGDRVKVTYTEATALALAEGGVGDSPGTIGELRTKVESEAARQAPAGGKPGLANVERTTLVANVFDIDRDEGVLTLRGTDGVPVDIRVRDKQALQDIGKDDQLVISYTQAAAVSIEPGR